MTENEAIEQLRIQRTFTNGNNAKVEAIDMAIQTLEEIQSYRAIGTVEEIKSFFNDNRKAGYKHGYSDGYNKVIDEFASELENHSIYADIGKGNEVKMEWVSPVARIKEVAEQMKGGAE